MHQSTVPSKGSMPGESLRNKTKAISFQWPTLPHTLYTLSDSLGTFPLRFLLATSVTVFLRYWQLNVSVPGGSVQIGV